jgi:hypothetical protein
MRSSLVAEPLLTITTPKGREAFLAWAERGLRPDEALVRVQDLVGPRRGMRTTPTDARARLVAKETPTLLRGGLTALVSYYVVPVSGLAGAEEHLENGEVSHAYETQLRVARVGRREASAKLAA